MKIVEKTNDPDLLVLDSGAGSKNAVVVSLILLGFGLYSLWIIGQSKTFQGGFLILGCIGVLFTGLGIFGMLGRGAVEFDRRRRLVNEWLSLFGLKYQKHTNFDDIDRIIVERRDRRRERGTDTVYRLFAIGPSGRKVKLGEESILEPARKLAKRVSDFTGWRYEEKAEGGEMEVL